MNLDTKIFHVLRELIVDMKDADVDAIQPNSTFEQLVLDSLDFVELQVAVKKTYKVDLLPDMFVSGTISSMEQLVGFISSKMSTVQA